MQDIFMYMMEDITQEIILCNGMAHIMILLGNSALMLKGEFVIMKR